MFYPLQSKNVSKFNIKIVRTTSKTINDFINIKQNKTTIQKLKEEFTLSLVRIAGNNILEKRREVWITDYMNTKRYILKTTH